MAVDGGTASGSRFRDPEYLAACERVLDRGVLTEGPEVDALEEEFARWLNPDDPPYVVALASGTAALTALLLAEGIGRGHRVAVPAMTFTATALAVLHAGAEPVFVDVDRSWTMCPDALRGTPYVDAVLPVDLHGVPARWAEIQYEAGLRGVPIIEDACPAYGARYGGRRVGDLGWGAAFSLNQGKLLAAGEGGLAVTRDPKRAEWIRALRVFGEFRRGAEFRRSTLPGFQWKLPELSAAVGRVSLRQLERAVHRATVNGEAVESALAGTPFSVDPIGSPRRAVRTKFRVWYDLPPGRRFAEDLLVGAGIPVTRSDVYPLPLHGALARYAGEGWEFPVTDRAWDRTVIIGTQQDPVFSWDPGVLEARCAALRGLAFRTDARIRRG